MENQTYSLKPVYVTGAIATFIVLCGIVLDMAVGSITGGDISALPPTAIDRFDQFHRNWALGLYNMDLLNIINQIILIPSIFALYIAHRKNDNGYGMLALILFLIGTTIFVTGNTALTMFDLSKKYFAAASEAQKNLIAAAGEAMLTKGSHGSLGVFIGFALPTIANILMAYVMIKGRIFNRTGSYLGLAGNTLMLLYMILVTFCPGAEKFALLLAMPGGLLVMAWMIIYMLKLLRLS